MDKEKEARGRYRIDVHATSEKDVEFGFGGQWPGPPGCTCDLTKRPQDRCTKGGWMRCVGANNAMVRQIQYREKVGIKGGPLPDIPE
jgi:hypothetical protein